MAGPGAGSLALLAAAALSEPWVRRRVLRDGSSVQTMYRPWLSFPLRYCKDTGVCPPGSDMEKFSDAFMHALR